jgi:Na+/melibiose symporter-like transporter
MLGFAITYLAGSLIDWKTAAAVQMGWPCIIVLLMLACPESPTWLMLKGKKELAAATLLNLRGDEEVTKQEISRIQENMDKQKEFSGENRHSSFFQTTKAYFKTAMKGTFLRPCIILTIMLSICWHWTGAYVLILHMVVILEEFEVPLEADWASAALGVYQVLGAILGIAISFYISRRKFYIGSGICIFIGSFSLATVVPLKKYDFFIEALKNNTFLSWIPVIALLIYFAGYSTGWVSVCFMLMGELLPSNNRELGCLIAVQASNIASIILVKLLPDLKELLGLDGLFWLFSAVSVFAMLFVYFCVPETFGKTLEEIEEHYRMICYPNRSGYVDGFPGNFNLAYTSD